MKLTPVFMLLASPAYAQVEPSPVITLSDAVWALALFLAVILVLAYIGSRR